MSKQKTLFQSWGCQTSNVSNEQPSTSKESNGDVIDLCGSFGEDDDDELLCEAEAEVSSEALPLPNEADNPTNISIGADGFTLTQAQSQNTNCPGFDKSAGKLWIYPTNYPVRDYQYNIVNKSLFKNTMVTLPTGLGKTFIAAVVMYNFYRWYPQGKVIFMAPTKPLVAQQIEACYNIMGIPQEHTAEMTGSMGPPKREKAWHEKRVFFLTPQVLTNDLSRGSCPAEFVKCLVIDEAHKALGNHAYCQVVRELVKYTEQFRVLALSATPGSDIKAVQQVLSNLLISHIEIRTEESIDIKQYSHERVVDKVVVPLGDELTKVKTKYIHIMEMVVSKLKRHGVLYNRDTTSLSKFLILKAREAFRQNPPERLPRTQFGVVEADFALAMSLYHGYELLQLHGSRSLFNYLEGIVSGDKGYGRTKAELSRNGDFNELIDMLRQKYTVPQDQTLSQAESVPFVIGHPKMEKLQEIVLDHFNKFKANKAETRVMIFSQYRDSVQEITDMLNRHRPLVKVMSFIGQSSAGKTTKGFTQKEQLKVMKQFREGGYNTLVSTCVGEEGLDIGDVDLIICFDAHKSPIRLVQRMGRTGRKREGRIVMLVTQGKEEQIYNQSQYSKRSIHKAILNGAKSLHFYQHSPRMLPDSVNPLVHKMHITISQNFKPTKKITTETKTDKTTKISSLLTKDKPDTSDGLITREEYEELKPWLVSEEEIPQLPRSHMVHLARDEDNSEEDIVPRGTLLSLSEWTPWQNTLQETSDVIDHSMQSKHLVQLMEFIQLQNLLDPEDDPYGLEMAAYFNEDDVVKPSDKDGAGDITRFCVVKPSEDESTVNQLQKQKKKRHSKMLPAFDVDQVVEEDDSEDDLPAFPFLQRKSKSLRDNINSDLPNLNDEEDLCSKPYSDSEDSAKVVKSIKHAIHVDDSDSNHSEGTLIRKVGRNDQKKLRKSEGLLKSKAKVLDLKMKSSAKTGKHKKIRNNNRSVIELLQTADDHDFDNTPPDNVTDDTSEDMPEVYTDGVKSVNVESSFSENERQYVIRTPPTVWDAIKLCEEAELEGNGIKIDLLELIDEWEKENQEGKYLILPKRDNNESVCKMLNQSKSGRKMSKSINDIHINTSYVVNNVIESNNCDKSNNKSASNETVSVCNNKNDDIRGNTDVQDNNDKVTKGNRNGRSDIDVDSGNNDVELSGSFTVNEANDEDGVKDKHSNSQDLVCDVTTNISEDVNKSDALDGINAEISCPAKEMDIVTGSFSKDIEKKQSQCSTSVQSNVKINKSRKRLTQGFKKADVLASTWLSDDSDDELFEKIKTPNKSHDKDITSPCLPTNISTQFTFTQAFNCLNSGSLTSETDSCHDVPQRKGQTHRSSNLNSPTSLPNTHSNKQICDSIKQSSSPAGPSKDFQITESDLDKALLSTFDQEENIEKSVAPKDSSTSRRLSTTSDESDQPQFDLGFDIDEDIIPPSPETSQPFQVSGKSRLSQTFTARFSQNRFSSTLSSNPCEFDKTEQSSIKNSDPISKRELRLENKTVSKQNDLSFLEEEDESQSILDTDSLLNDKAPPARNVHHDNPVSKNKSVCNEIQVSKSTDLSSIKSAIVEKVIEDKNICANTEAEVVSNDFESSFALLDDDFDEWIDGDLDDMTNNASEVKERKQSSDMTHCENTASVKHKTDNLEVSNDNSVIVEAHKNNATHTLQSKRKKNPILKSRKSIFCSTDLSMDDSFGPEIECYKRNASVMNTPKLKEPCDIFKNTSTPVIGPNELMDKFTSPAITPVRDRNVTKLSDDLTDEPDETCATDTKSLSNSDNDDSFVVRKKTRKPLCLESPKSQCNLDSPITNKNTFKQSSLKKAGFKMDSYSSNEKSWCDDDDFDDSLLKKNNDYFTKRDAVLQIQNDSDDDFDRSSMIKHASSDGSDGRLSKQTHLRKPKKSEKSRPKSVPKRTSNPFVEEEADLSEEEDVDASSDESDHSDLDKYEGSFIHDTQFSQSQGLDQTDIQALYLKSVKSPVGVKGGYKLQYDYKDVDVFSQRPHEEESEYMEDSFCVGSEDDDWLAQDDYHGEITVCNNRSDILHSGKKRRRGVSNLQTGRQRELHFGRMKALDQLKSKLAKKNKQTHVDSGHVNPGNKCIGTKSNINSKKTSRIAILEESSSDEDMKIPNEHSIISPILNMNKKRKRVRLLSSSDEEIQESKVVCTQQRRTSLCDVKNSTTSREPKLNSDSSREISSNESNMEFEFPDINRKITAPSTSLSREERLQRQKMKQEEFKKKIESSSTSNTKSQTDSDQPVTMTKIKDKCVNDTSDTLKVNSFEEKDDGMDLLIHPNSSKIDTLCILVDSKEISGGQDIISSLRFTHKIHVSAAQLPGCDYIVSNRMAVERKQWSDFSNGANRNKLIERIQHLSESYDRPCLIIEKDRVKPGEEKSERQQHWTKYIDTTCTLLLKSRVKVLFTDTQVETASVLADLCQLEKRKGMNIGTEVEMMSKNTNMVKFYISFPKLNYVHALNLCYGFKSVSGFLKSSITEIEKKGKMSTNRATEVFNHIRRQFDTSMLPTKHK